MKRVLTMALLSSVAMLGIASSSVHAAHKDIVDTAVGAGQFKTLVAAVKAAGLVKTLKSRGPFTVFAPNDAAFAKLPKKTLESLLEPENKDKLVSILTYHVVPGRLKARDVFGRSSAPTVNGQQLPIRFEEGKLTVAGSRVVATDIECTNGVIHVIDKVMLPSFDNIPTTAVKAGQFKTLVAAVKAAGLLDVLAGKGPFTVFAPTDKAFASLPKGTVEELLKPENKQKLIDILKYHVVRGRVYARDAVKAGKARTLQGQSVKVRFTSQGVKINDSLVIKPDVDTTNGVIHIIDQVLLPKKMSSAQALRMLRDAIHKGVPMYNKGDHHGCAVVYENVCRKLMTMSDELPPMATRVLKRTLSQSKHIRHAGMKAWTLRHGMDRAYQMMSETN